MGEEPPISRTITELVPGLWVGGFPRPKGTVVLRMREVGIEVVISTTRSVPKLEGIDVVSIPFNDGAVPSIQRLRPGIEAAYRAMVAGRPVLVHCAAGLNRSGLVAGLVLHEFGWPGNVIVDLIQERRAGALHNERFAAYLRSRN